MNKIPNGVSPTRLTPKQNAFCNAYILCDRNQTKAAIEAGYSKKTAQVMGSQLMQHPLIKRQIAKLEAIEAEHFRSEIATARQNLVNNLKCNVTQLVDEKGKLIPLHKLPQDLASIIDGIEIDVWEDDKGQVHHRYKVKISPKGNARDQMFKITGEYAPEKIESKNLNATIDLDKLCMPPEGALDPDVIEIIEGMSNEP